MRPLFDCYSLTVFASKLYPNWVLSGAREGGGGGLERGKKNFLKVERSWGPLKSVWNVGKTGSEIGLQKRNRDLTGRIVTQ